MIMRLKEARKKGINQEEVTMVERYEKVREQR
jgi:hypothetical protein